jgi:hypothetical protein
MSQSGALQREGSLPAVFYLSSTVAPKAIHDIKQLALADALEIFELLCNVEEENTSFRVDVSTVATPATFLEARYSPVV